MQVILIHLFVVFLYINVQEAAEVLDIVSLWSDLMVIRDSQDDGNISLLGEERCQESYLLGFYFGMYLQMSAVGLFSLVSLFPLCLLNVLSSPTAFSDLR
jgi:hypothetical protein